jgi:hypothetical protein
VGLCCRVWDRGSGTATLELCAIGLGRVEGHGSKQVGYAVSVKMIRFCLWVGRVGALARDELEDRVEDKAQC